MVKRFAEPLYRKNIRLMALKFREIFGIENELYIDVVRFLEFVLLRIGINFMIVENDEMEEEALTIPSEMLIKIREDVYEGAVSGVGRYRFTIMHEIGHIFLHTEDSICLARGKDNVEVYRDPEWQADAFAGEFLVPSHLTKNMSPAEISIKCGVSLQAATYQKRKQKKIS